MKSISKYARLIFEGTLLLAIILYFFGPLINGYYSSKKILVLWVVFMGILFACAKKIIPHRDKVSVRNEFVSFIDFFEMKKKDWIIVFVLLVGAFAIRIVNLQWNDAMHIFHPDEGRIVEPALEMTMSWLDLYSDHFVYPGQFLSKFVALILIVANKLTGSQDNVMLAYTVFRSLTVLLGATSVIPAYLIGEKIWKKHGWMLAVAVALFPSFIRFSVQVTGDVSGLFFQLCVLVCSLYWINSKKKGCLVLMGLLSAASTMEKWHNGVICVYIAIIVIIGSVRKGTLTSFIKDAITALVSWVVGLLIIAPNLLWHFNTVVDEFLYVWNYDSGAARGGRWMNFIGNYFSYFGLFMVVVVCLGVVFAVIKHDTDMIVIIGGLTNYFIMNLIMNRLFERWGCLYFFTMLLFAVLGLRMVVECARKPGVVVASVLGSIFILSMITFDIKLIVWTDACKEKDTRVASETVFAENGINIDNTLSGYYTTFAPGGRRLPKQATAIAFMSENMSPYSIQDKKAMLENNDYKYIVLSDYFDVSDCEPVDREPIMTFKSVYPDLWYMTNGDGSYKVTEIQTIINTIRSIKLISDSDFVGPTLKVYDISNGYWEVAR